MNRRGAAVLAAVLALATPGTALAQSAGDDQYRDPFAGENESEQGGSGGGEDTPTPPPSPAPTPAPSPSAPAGTTAAEPTATTAGTLPRTGLGAGWITAAGLALIVAGAGLRRSIRA
jgi:LPXTG-motif cell wall-anchored protein